MREVSQSFGPKRKKKKKIGSTSSNDSRHATKTTLVQKYTPTYGGAVCKQQEASQLAPLA